MFCKKSKKSKEGEGSIQVKVVEWEEKKNPALGHQNSSLVVKAEEIQKLHEKRLWE